MTTGSTKPSSDSPSASDENPLMKSAAALKRTIDSTTALAAEARSGADLALTTPSDPLSIKRTAASHRAAIHTAIRELERDRDAVLSQLRELEQQAQAALEPLNSLTARLDEVVWTVNLYLGRDEQITTLTDGRPAPADTPISVRQLVLSMDEETTIAAEEGGTDYRDLTDFDNWITDPAHLQQVLPEPRGVVVLVPRRSGRDYGDPWTNAHGNQENHRSYFLIRNGERLFRMTTDFEVGRHLTPARDEFTAFFTERRYNTDTGQYEQVPLVAGTSQWLRAEQSAGERRRHFMRAALILQGLIDRTTVLHPLPAPQISVLDPASYDAGHIQLISDADNTLGVGRQPFYDWLAERNAELRPGMRIVGAFNSAEFNRLRDTHGRHERLHPDRAEYPNSTDIHEIEEVRPNGDLVIRYRRNEEVWINRGWGNGELRTPKIRAVCTVRPSDRFILPIDAVTIGEMTDYLGARTERHAYEHLLPLLTAAIAAKTAEDAAEEPFRSLLTAQIISTYGDDPDHVSAQIPNLIHWWKYTNRRHRALVAGDNPDAERRAVRQILAEYKARRDTAARAGSPTDTAVTARLLDHVPDAMLIARGRDGRYFALTPQPREHQNPPAHPRVFVRKHTTTARRTNVELDSWTILNPAQVKAWQILHHTPTWTGWDLTITKRTALTDPEIDHLVDCALALAREHTTSYWSNGTRTEQLSGTPVAVTYEPSRDGRGTAVVHLDARTETLTVRGRLLTNHIPDMTTRALRVTWRRTTGGQLRFDAASHAPEQRWRFHHDRRDEEASITPPWRNGTLLWSDNSRIDSLHTDAELLHTAQLRARQLRTRATATMQHLAHAWEERQEATELQRFREDYHDPALWEGHRKTLRGLTFPHWQHRQLRHLLDRLAEDGMPLEGHTITTAAALLPHETFELPEDVATLPIAPARQQATAGERPDTERVHDSTSRKDRPE